MKIFADYKFMKYLIVLSIAVLLSVFGYLA